MKLNVQDIEGHSQGELEVTFPLAEGDKGTQAVHDVVVAYQAAQRRGTACTKTVGEVAGSNKKPWRQKGTGRARAGSFASPLWRGGGVVFGPRPRDFSKKVSKKTRQLALRKALGERLKAGDVIVVDQLKLESHKTRQLADVLARFNVSGSALVVVAESDRNLYLASRNLPGVDLMTPEFVNTYLVLRRDKIIFTRDAFESLENRLKN